MLLAAFACSDPDSRLSQGTPLNTGKMASPFLAINSIEPDELGGLKGEGMSPNSIIAGTAMGTDYSRSPETEKSNEVNRLMGILREDQRQKHLVSPRMCQVYNPS